MKFRGPDEAVKSWYRAHERASAPSPQAIGQSGRKYARRCSNPRCGRVGIPIMLPGKHGTYGPKCPACCSNWEWTDEITLSGQFLSGKGGHAPPSLLLAGDTWIRLAEIRAFGRGEGEVYVQWLCKASESREDVARVANEHPRLAGRHWSPNDVRRAIARARRWLESELSFRGMLSTE